MIHWCNNEPFHHSQQERFCRFIRAGYMHEFISFLFCKYIFERCNTFVCLNWYGTLTFCLKFCLLKPIADMSMYWRICIFMSTFFISNCDGKHGKREIVNIEWSTSCCWHILCFSLAFGYSVNLWRRHLDERSFQNDIPMKLNCIFLKLKASVVAITNLVNGSLVVF